MRHRFILLMFMVVTVMVSAIPRVNVLRAEVVAVPGGREVSAFQAPDPSLLTLIGQYGANVRRIEVHGSRVYFGSTVDNTTSIVLLDTRDAARPVVRGSYTIAPDAGTRAPFISGIEVLGGHAYVTNFSGYSTCCSSGALDVRDISDPAQPTARSHISFVPFAWLSDVYVAGTTAYVSGSGYVLQGTICALQIYDVGDPGNLSRRGCYLPNPNLVTNAVEVSSAIAYLVIQGNVQLIDVSDAALPTLLSTIDVALAAKDVAVAGTIAYVAADTAGVMIYDVSDRVQPRPRGGVDTPGQALDVEIVGNRLFVADEVAVHVYDVTDPVTPQLLTSYNTPGSAIAVRAFGDRVYVADDANGLLILQLDSPPLGVQQWLPFARQC
jgi:hypothetical protein